MTKNNKQTIVIKLGTSVLTAGSQTLNKPRLVELVRQCVTLRQAGHQVIVVSSGAVAAGRGVLQQQIGHSLAEKQMLAAIGQGQLIHLWQSLFSIYDVTVAQMLLTRADLEHRERYLTARDMLTKLLEHHVVPIINENDAVATSEIKVGDNDNLSAYVAILANADKLVLLTDQHGLFTADPRANPDAQLIEQVTHINDELRALAGGSGTQLGTGGMATKLQAADIAQRAGVDVVIAKGSEYDILPQVLTQTAPSTTFLKFDAPVGGRKRWLLSGPKSTGKIICDNGAINAVCNQGASLLAKGIVSIEGQFKRGELVQVFCQQGTLQAQGLTSLSNQELGLVIGRHSSEFAQCLGFESAEEIIHRDNLVLLNQHSQQEVLN
ncbi:MULTISPECIES: glutamate 5-kinase [Pseudoalteromonas]|uniref:glutamate 5-kinase n=1 Tax=Pseudoalteromonas TaxID=53246 RepID=UPI001EF5A691|nr:MULTISPECIES: glutamate 5-kinase [Pseudoalteromonas]MCG7542008.1 glutamate 5-kinase [Pseudoalteromonas sp. OF7H-1]USE68244.1 glutamate 5-kinase [Pseudoalteromonas flavipulchra]